MQYVKSFEILKPRFIGLDYSKIKFKNQYKKIVKDKEFINFMKVLKNKALSNNKEEV